MNAPLKKHVLLGALLLGAVYCGSFAQENATNASAKAVSKKLGRDSLMFRNGDVLFGSLNSIDPEAGIKWMRTDALSEFRFLPEMVSQLDLAAVPAHPSQVSSNLCSVQMSNGDQLQGVLLSYDGEKVRLDTWFAGVLELPKASVALIVPLGLPKKTIFEGPTGLDGWTMGQVNAGALVESGEWMFQNNALYAMKSASIARDLHLPESAAMSFDLEWRGFFHIAIALYTEYLQPINLANKETEPKFGGFYSLQINPFSANLLPVKQTEPLRYLGQASLQALAQKNSAHVDIRVSKSKRLIALLIDGALVKQWIDTDEFAGTGTAIRFVHQGQGAVKLTNLKVTEWDGTFEEPITITPNKTQDLARLKNGDRVIGNIKSMRDGKMSIEAAGTTLEVPVSRVKQVELASPPAKVGALKPNTVRAYFASGNGSVTFDLRKWTTDEVAASSENFGSATFKPNAFSRILFDLSPAGAQ
ncbi:MAG TPA: hypothetical protein VGR78_11575 [Verrucomicrobiae bacterium]|jgi:hypothetical protein|nr:hypothetical protein [Verrucomicrobiae bacterium]